VVFLISLAAGAAGDLDVARQALNDGVWASALAVADIRLVKAKQDHPEMDSMRQLIRNWNSAE
jgi:hypothetical protein